ncbi:MAG: hypothetical protein IJT16_14190 [Lachnospiraceae bacterium]|nr:hypothetical protein [Lachnospiraceae bacterium]
MNLNQKKAEHLIAILTLLAGLISAVFYIFLRERAEYNLDYTDTLLWAAASVESGALISPDFWYAYIIPFSGSILMIPLVMLFGVTYLTHELGMTLFILILAIAVFFCMRTLGLNISQSAFVTGAFLLLLLGSPITRMIYFGHVIHYSLAILFTCVSVILLARSNQRLFYLMLLAWCFLCCLNGSSALLLFLFPITGAIILERLLDPKELSLQSVKAPLLTVLGMSFAGLLGFAAKQFYIGRSYNNAYEEGFSSFLGYDRWLWKEQSFLLRFITLLTGWVSDGEPLLSVNGVFVLMRFMLAVLLLILPVFALISYRKFENRMLRLMVLSYWVLFGLTQLIYSVSYVQTENWRLGALLGMAILVSILYLLWLIQRKYHTSSVSHSQTCEWRTKKVAGPSSRARSPWLQSNQRGTSNAQAAPAAVSAQGNWADTKYLCRFGYLGLGLVMFVCAINILSLIRLPHGSNVNGYDRLAKILLENDLTYGYSELWNGANVTTVLSDSRVKIRPIYFSDGAYTINPYQSEAGWYEDQPETEKYFVLVTASEKEKTENILSKNAIKEIEFEDDQTILVFDRNIFENGEPVFKESNQ